MRQDSILLDEVAALDKDLQPYVRLWAAVMRVGVQDYCTASNDARVKGVRDNRIHWFESDVVAPGSFVWLCHVFDIDENKARARIVAKRKSLALRKELRHDLCM